MSKNKKISELNLQELEDKKKTLKGVFIGLSIVIVISCALLFYFAFTQKNYGLLAVAIGSLGWIAPGLIFLKQINQEIKKRNEL